jgi:hypothetical protein
VGAANSSCVRSSDVFAPGALAVFLRKHPNVVATWCMQMGATYRALARANALHALAVPLDPRHDVYVKDNGMLLLGNCSFTAPTGAPSTVGTRSLFTDLMRNILTEVLCLSRSITLPMVPRGSLANDDEGDEEGEPEAEAIVAGKIKSIPGRSTIAVAKGCCVDITPSGGMFKAVAVSHVRSSLGATPAHGDDEDNQQEDVGVLYVDTVGDNHVATVTAVSPTANTNITTSAGAGASSGRQTLRVYGARDGVLTLQLRLREVDGLSFASTVYVKVLPETPMASTDMAEMVELLEAGPQDEPAGLLFMRAQGLRKRSYDEVYVSKKWDAIVEDLQPYKQS